MSIQKECIQKECIKKQLQEQCLDQFFTADPKLIIQLWKQEIQKYFTNTHPLIEPSAGDGRFSKYVVFDKMYDIQPFKNTNTNTKNTPHIIKQDFLTTTDQNAHYLGNPPFGNVANLANKFIKHCCSNNAQSISFILPHSFKKESMKKVFNEYYYLVFEYDYDSLKYLYVKWKLHLHNVRFKKKTQHAGFKRRLFRVYFKYGSKEIINVRLQQNK